MANEIAAALIQGVATALAAGIGFGAVVSQIRKQAQQGRQSILDAEARRIKSEMYADGVSAARELADSAIGFASALNSARFDIGFASNALSTGMNFPLPRARYRALLDLHGEMGEAAVRFAFLIENRRIIDERLIIFRDAVSSVMHDLREIVTSQWHSALMKSLPVDAPDGTIYPYSPPLGARFEAVERQIDSATNCAYTVTAYMEDFIVEIQNLMLGDIFPNKASHRTPIDPAQFVIKLEDFELIKSRLALTPWGKNAAAIEAEITAKLSDARNKG